MLSVQSQSFSPIKFDTTDMDPSIPDRLDQQVQSLVQRLATGCQNDSLGSATVAVYDTAWLSMVSKVDAGQKSWLFPECFQYLLDNQLRNGGWKCDATPDDGLLNTLAALLAIQKHATGRDRKIARTCLTLRPVFQKLPCTFETAYKTGKSTIACL